MTIRNIVSVLILGLSPMGLAGQALRAVPTPAAASAPTSIPALVPYSGVALAGDGRAFGGEVHVTFLIYKEEQGGDPLWTESQMTAIDTAGRYKVQLGASEPSGLPTDLFTSGEARWLEVQIAGAAAQPRVLLASVPYALKAADAATLGGLPASAFVLAGSRNLSALAVADTSAAVVPNSTSNVTTAGGTSGTVPLFTGSTSIGNSILFQNSTTGIGVGIVPASTTALDVNGKAVVRGIFNLSRTGNATTSKGYNSYPFIFNTSAYSTSTSGDVAPIFALEAEVVGNKTANPSATFNLLYGHNGGNPGETGLYFNSNGTIHFASGQSFPSSLTTVYHNSTLTGNGTSGTPLGLTFPLSLSGSAYGVVQGSDTGSGEGVLGTSASGVGVLGSASGSAGIGVEANSDDYIGLEANGYTAGITSTGADYGVIANAVSTVETAIGVKSTGSTYGVQATGGYIGVQATTSQNYGIGVNAVGDTGVQAFSNQAAGTGLFAEASNGSQDDYAVYGVSNSGYAGVFSGNVAINGTLTKSAGTFRIDHPLDPGNKYLSHSFVESPDMMNIYNGNIITDAGGDAVVRMPDYFEALNRDFRYQLTVIGQFAQAIVAAEMSNRTFAIKTDKPNVKVSWQVTGIRQDAYANAHRTPVEEEKPGKERGTYLHPELFGQPKEKGREWAVHPRLMSSTKGGVAK